MGTNQTKTYLFQMTIPSVQKFISASRKSADLWAGSLIVSYLMKKLLNEVINYKNIGNKIQLIYPYTDNSFDEKETTANTPNVAIFIVKDVKEDEADKLKTALERRFKILINRLVEFGIKKFLEDTKFLREDINNYKNDYLELSKYQIRETLRFYITYQELDEYKQTTYELADIINYEKNSDLSLFRDIEEFENENIENIPVCFESWRLTKYLTTRDNWEKFYKYDRENNFLNIKGAYRCSNCGEHTIIGATLDDWRGNKIWKDLWNTKSKIFNKGERLCGVCLVKRYFREYMQEIEGIEDESLGFPSTSEIAATLFKKEILEAIKKESEINDFLQNLGEFFYLGDTKGNSVKNLREFVKKEIKNDKKSLAEAILNIDGEWFIEDIWKNKNDYEIIGADDKKATEMLNFLDKIYKFLKSNGVTKHYKPSEYYAVILLDGDSIGEKLDTIKNLGNSIETHQKFSKTLSELSKKFKNIVENYFGALIYSGGDDVLALVPVENALKCANEIQNEFKNILSNEFPTIHIKSSFSMSGAIIYAHHKLPLSYVLNEARKCEEEAKEEGKNRVCLRYIKRSLSSAEAVIRWIEIDKIKNLPVNKQFIYQLREFRKVFKFNNYYKNIEDLEPFYQRSYSHRDIAKKIRDLQENLIISLLHGKDISLSPKDFINLIKRIDVYKIIKANNGNKIKIYDLDKIENLLLVKEEINIY